MTMGPMVKNVMQPARRAELCTNLRGLVVDFHYNAVVGVSRRVDRERASFESANGLCHWRSERSDRHAQLRECSAGAFTFHRRSPALVQNGETYQGRSVIDDQTARSLHGTFGFLHDTCRRSSHLVYLLWLSRRAGVRPNRFHAPRFRIGKPFSGPVAPSSGFIPYLVWCSYHGIHVSLVQARGFRFQRP